MAQPRTKMKKKIWLLLLTSLLFSKNRTVPLDKLYVTPLKIKEKNFNLWLALSPKQQHEGLSLLTESDIPLNYGMLFIYPLNAYRTFWMKDMLLNLDIAFIKEDGVISDIYYSMKKQSMNTFSSTQKVRYVLELKEDILKGLPLHVGDKIVFPKSISSFSKP